MLSIFAGALALVAIHASSALAAFQDSEAQNFSKIGERWRYEGSDPRFQALLAQTGVQQQQELAQTLANDPERSPANLCANHGDGCEGDPRLYNWGDAGFGIELPILFTARNGATISGHVFATLDGPAKRPGIVITNGSVQAPEQLYLYAATTLAKKGYVVMTWDPMDQGRSDEFGEGVDQLDGYHSQTGPPFYWGTEDALDFFFSTPDGGGRPGHYVPASSCGSGTSHDPKQERRVAAGLDSPHNPLYYMLDTDHVGIAGHSLGASAVSYIGQADPRVKAIVAWDNLAADPAGTVSNSVGTCIGHPNTVPLTKPALGMSADYFLTPTPYSSPPDRQSKSTGSNPYTTAGVDTGELIIRGGTHYEFSYISSDIALYPFSTATLRGQDMVAWYTGAWFDKYVKGDPTADQRLLTTRWLADPREAQVDPTGDGNMYSTYFDSRLDITRSGGGNVTCETLRSGTASCPALSANDGRPPNYSYLNEARTLDGGGQPINFVPGSSGSTQASNSTASRRARVSAPSSIDLSRSHVLPVSLRLAHPASVDATLTGKGSLRGITAGSTQRRMGAGRKQLRIPLTRTARAGRYRLGVVVQTPRGPRLWDGTLRLVK